MLDSLIIVISYRMAAEEEGRTQLREGLATARNHKMQQKDGQ